MASVTNQMITADDLSTGGLLPTEYAAEVIQDAAKSSVMLTRARQIQMSTRTRTQPFPLSSRTVMGAPLLYLPRLGACVLG